MSTVNHPQSCRCSLHAQLQARRHECYRRLAQAILGPGAPHEDLALARALAEHSELLKPAARISPMPPHRAA
jgi:hypothetical protein